MSEKKTIINFDEVKTLITQMAKPVMDIKDEAINEKSMAIFNGMIKGAIEGSNTEESIMSMVLDYRQNGFTKETVLTIHEQLKEAIEETIASYGDISEKKKEMLNFIGDLIIKTHKEAVEKYVGDYDVEIQFQLCSKGAQLPTYAHDTDACADVYASETVVLPPHSFGNFIGTGLKAVIPRGWFLEIRPRSGMSAKTKVRVSNTPGTIDCDYRNEIKVLLDNYSDEPYTINAGDRVAQMRPVRNYTFRAKQVDDIDENTSRGLGGFGSTGK